jgi:hypothetical protein
MSSRHIKDHIHAILLLKFGSSQGFCTCLVSVFGARLILKLSCMQSTLWDDFRVDQVVQSVLEALEPKWLSGNSLRRSGLEIRWHFVQGTWRPPPLVEKVLSGGNIKATKGAWQVPLWWAFVASQVVLLGETWWPGSNTLVWSASTTWTSDGLVPPVPRDKSCVKSWLSLIHLYVSTFLTCNLVYIYFHKVASW